MKTNSAPDASGHNEVGTVTAPNLEQLREEFAWAVRERGNNLTARQQVNHDARVCWWSGQSADGRKWTPRRGEDEVFPWPGASDLKVPLVDIYIRKHVAFLMVLWHKMRTTIHGVEANDDGWARRMTSFWRWMKYTQMTEARAENKLLANYWRERGAAVMGVFWCKQKQLAYEEVDLETILARAQTTQDERFADLHEKILLPEFDAETVALLAELLPDATAKSVRKIPAELRTDGVSRYARPTVLKNRPKLVALALNQDVFLPPDATSMEDARVVFYRELLSESALRERVHSYDWDPDWVEAMIETQKGKVTIGDDQTRNARGDTQRNGRGLVDNQKSFEVIHAYRRLADEEGVPGIYCTVFNPGLVAQAAGASGKRRGSAALPEYAHHELLGYAHGAMPFVLLLSEQRSRRIDDSRGYGEVAGTLQNGIKAEVDQRIDRGSIATVPPSFHPPGEAPDKWGPGVQVPTSRPTGYGFFDPPRYDPTSEKNEMGLRKLGDEYFGFAVDPENALDSQTMRQELADDWMAGQVAIDTMCLQLCQQYMPDEFYFRVVGSAQGKALHATREEIQGKFDMAIGYDVRELDPEHTSEMIGLMQQTMVADVNGITDHDEALAYMYELVSPNLGERLLKPGESASQEQIDDEQTVFVKLMAGIQVPVKPGQAYQLRLKTLETMLQQNAGAQQLIQNNEMVKEAFAARVKALNFQVQQQENAVIGRGGPAFKPKVKA